ncbi:MAG: hypothetical protein IT307_11125 [Chloroflexi bacterium]|nr:hypothetical protein [Chloroflexota bacterium]
MSRSLEPPVSTPLPPVLFEPDRMEAGRQLTPGRPRDPGLQRRAREIMAVSVQAGLPVSYLGTMPLFADHRVYGAPHLAHDWVLLDAASDPLLTEPGGFPVPDRVLRDLRRVADRVEFDAVYVAHEVPRGAVTEERPLRVEAFLPPAPPKVERLSRRLGRTTAALWTVAAAPLVFAGVMGGLVVAGAAVAGAAGLDPVLLGAVVRPGRAPAAGEPAAWFHLGHWTYGEA